MKYSSRIKFKTTVINEIEFQIKFLHSCMFTMGIFDISMLSFFINNQSNYIGTQKYYPIASSKYLMAFLASLPLSSSIHPLATNPCKKIHIKKIENVLCKFNKQIYETKT